MDISFLFFLLLPSGGSVFKTSIGAYCVRYDFTGAGEDSREMSSRSVTSKEKK